MSEKRPRRTKLVLADVRSKDGTMWREVSLTQDGGLSILGHDLRSEVEGVDGYTEYEFERRLSAADTDTLHRLLGLGANGDLLSAIEGRFTSTRELEDYLKESGISGQFWNRIGD